MHNADQNKRSNLSKEEFHGTARDPIDITGVDMKKTPKLPDEYTVVEPAELDLNKSILMSKPTTIVHPEADKIEGEIVKDRAWACKVNEVISSKSPDNVKSRITLHGLHTMLRTLKKRMFLPNPSLKRRLHLFQCVNMLCSK